MEIFELKTFSFFWSSPFLFDPHARIHINKLLEPPPQDWLLSRLELRYPGAGPASVAYKLMFVILLFYQVALARRQQRNLLVFELSCHVLSTTHCGVFALSLFFAER